MIVSRITTKAQTTIPQAVRTALGLGPGDSVAYEIVEGHVRLTKVRELRDDPFATFEEWDGDADRRAYADF